MKIFLDDERQAPRGWEQTYSARGTIIILLVSNDISEISLDHDLGDEEKFGTGYDVLKWIEEQVFLKEYIPPKIHIHTANPPARAKMESAVRKIGELCESKARR